MKAKVTRVSWMALGILLIALFAIPALADPCLVVYPTGSCVYHYDTSIYYTVEPGDPLYDPMYDRGGEVLLRIDTNEVDLSIYQAPGLTGFAPSTDGNEGYFFTGHPFDLVVDGFNGDPITYHNILLVFEQDPDGEREPVDGDETSALHGVQAVV